MAIFAFDKSMLSIGFGVGVAVGFGEGAGFNVGVTVGFGEGVGFNVGVAVGFGEGVGFGGSSGIPTGLRQALREEGDVSWEGEGGARA